MSAQEELELLYRRLGFQVTTSAGRLSVSKQMAGFELLHDFYFLEDDDPDSIVSLIEVLQDSASDPKMTIVISDSYSRHNEYYAFFDGYAKGPMTVDTWLNKVLNDKEVCRIILDSVPTFSKTFVLPLIKQAEFSDIKNWAIGVDKPDESFGHVVVILGPAGFGKTTVTREIAKSCASKHLADPSLPIPILIPLEDFRSERNWQDLLSAYSRSMNTPEITPGALKWFIDKGRAFLIVDGLDELAERGGINAAVETLKELVKITKSGRLLITAREAYLPEFLNELPHQDNVTYLNILGINPKDRKVLIGEYSEDIQECVVSILDSVDDSGTNLSTHPILLIYLAEVISSYGSVPSLQSKSTSVSLLCEVITLLHTREIERQKLGLNVEDYAEFFGILAVETIKSGLISVDEDNLVVPDGYDWLHMLIDDRIKSTGSVSEQSQLSKLKKHWFTSLRTHPAIRIVDTPSEKNVSFRHPFFRDAIATSYLHSQLDAGKEIATSPIDVGEQVTMYVTHMLSQILRSPFLKDISPSSGTFTFYIAAIADHLSKNRKSLDDKVDASSILSCWAERKLSGITLSAINYESVSFDKTDLQYTTFSQCKFNNCDFTSSYLSGVNFDRCIADVETIKRLKSHGTANLPHEYEIDKGECRIAQSEAEEFTKKVLSTFFHRFIRAKKGQHIRSSRISSFTRGLDPIAAEFTKKHLIPEVKRKGIISEVPSIEVYAFNSDYQRAGDAIVFNNEIDTSIEEVYEILLAEAVRELS